MHSPRRDNAVMNDAARVSWDHVQVSLDFSATSRAEAVYYRGGTIIFTAICYRYLCKLV